MPKERKATFHLNKGDQRTTASLSPTLAELLAFKLEHHPDNNEAHQAIRSWLQARIDDVGDPKQVNVSQYLQQKALLEVSDDKLSSQHEAWSTGDL